MSIVIGGGSQEPQEPQRQRPGALPSPPLPARRPTQQAPPQEPQEHPAPIEQDDPQGYGAMIDRVLGRRQQQADEMLLTSFEAAKNANPALAREAQQLGPRLGVPAETAERNIDVIRHMDQRRRLEDERFAAINPIFARKLRDPEFARVVKDDWDNLSAYERAAYGVETAALNIERGRIGLRMQMNAWAGTLDSPEDLRRVTEIDARMQQIPPTEGIPARTAETLRYMRDPIIAGAAVAGTAAAASAVFPPAEVITAPAAFAIGALTVGIPQAAAVEGGNLYLNLLRRPGVNPNDAWFASVGVGAVNSALETAGAGFLAAPFKKAISKAAGEAINEALVRPTITKAGARAALTYVKTQAGEGATELLQEVSQIVAEGSVTGEWEGIGKRLADVAIGTAEGMALLALPGPAMQFAHDRRRVAAAQQNAQTFERMQEAAVASTLRNEAPETFEKFAQDTVAGTAAETVYIDAAKFEEVLRQGGKEEGGKPLFDDLEKVAPGLADGVRAEAARGGDIVMPSSVFLAKLSGTEVGKALTPHVRFDVDALSPFEAEQVEALAKEQETAVTEQAEKIDTTNEQVRAIEEGLAGQLVATGRMGKADANTNAKLWGAFVRTQSERLGMEPAEFQKAYSLRAQRGEVTQEPGALVDKDEAGVTRGAFLFRNREGKVAPLVLLTPDSNSSTFGHESSHAFLSIYADLAAQKANPVILDDFNTFLQWAGVDSVETWNAMSLEQQRPHQERFADGFESYMLKGEAPAPGLRRLYDRLAAFMREVWRTLKGENLSPEIRAVMDRMLASEEAVRTTQAIRGAVPAFQTAEEAGMTPEQWAAHQEQQQAADADAVAKLTAAWLRVMRWLSGAKGKALRALQAEAKGQRDALRGEVGAAVQAQPLYRAARWLRTGEMVNDDGTHTQGEKDSNHKIRTEDVAALGLELPGMTRADGLPADMVAGVFGFESGEQMVRALASAAPIEGAIEGAIDARMVSEHSDLADPAQRDAAVEATLYTEARRRFVAAELRALTKSLEPERVTLAAAKEEARIALESKRVSELTPRTFTVAARRASIEAQKAAAAGKTAEAIAWKRRQLVQEAMADLAVEERAKVAQAVKFFRKFNDTDKNIAKARDIDIAYSAQALAAHYSLGPPIVGEQRRDLVRQGLATVAAEHPVEAARLGPLLDVGKRADDQPFPYLGQGAPLDYRNLTVAQFREVAETGAQLWGAALDEMTAEIAGQKVEIGKANAALFAQLRSLPPRPPIARTAQGQSPSPFRRRLMDGWSARAGLRIWEHEARALDGDKDGPFQKYLVRPAILDTTAYTKAKAASIRDLGTSIVEAKARAGALWHANIAAPELVLPGQPVPVLRGKRELLGFLLHNGTTSNLQADMIGRGWGEWVGTGEDRILNTTRVDAFLARMVAEGFLDPKVDGDWAMHWWGAFAKLLPQAQKTHKARFHREFKTLEHREVRLGDRVLSGGYVPKRASRYEADPRMFQRPDEYTSAAADFQYSMGTARDFTLGRDESYRPPLTHDISELLSNADQELKFIHLELTAANVERLLRSKTDVVAADGTVTRVKLEDALNAYDRTIVNGILRPWAKNMALQRVSVPGRYQILDTAARAMMHSATLTMLAVNLPNAMLQAGGVANILAQTNGAAWRSAAWTFFTSPAQAYQTMTAKSERMAQVYDGATRKIEEEAQRASLGPVAAGIVGFRQTMARWGRFPQLVFQLIANTVGWHAGYAEAIKSGKSEEAAIERADQVFRMSQGEARPESVADFQVTTPAGKLWLQFGNYASLVLNNLMGPRGFGPMARTYAWAVLLPTLWEVGVKTLFRGGQDDEDDDGWVMDDLAKSYLNALQRNTVGLVPIAGPITNSLIASDAVRVTEQPGIAVLRESLRGVLVIDDALLSEEELTDAQQRALFTFLTIATGIPMAAPVRTVQRATSER